MLLCWEPESDEFDLPDEKFWRVVRLTQREGLVTWKLPSFDELVIVHPASIPSNAEYPTPSAKGSTPKAKLERKQAMEDHRAWSKAASPAMARTQLIIDHPELLDGNPSLVKRIRTLSKLAQSVSYSRTDKKKLQDLTPGALDAILQASCSEWTFKEWGAIVKSDEALARQVAIDRIMSLTVLR